MEGLPGIPFVLFEEGSILIAVDESNIKKFQSLLPRQSSSSGHTLFRVSSFVRL
jgi:hypothetical protein